MSVTTKKANKSLNSDVQNTNNDIDRILNTQLNLLKTIAIQEGFTDYDIDISESSNGGNYFGILHTAIIRSRKLNETDNIHIFMKVAAERMRKTFPVHEMYCNEIFVYKVLSKLYEEMQLNETISENEMYKFTKFYGSNECDTEIIALENMSNKGYNVTDRFQCITLDYAEVAVKNLAKFHAFSYILERRKPELFNKFVKVRKGSAYTDYNGPERMKKQQSMITESAVKNLTNSKHSEKIKNFCEDMCSDICKYVKINKYPALCHGDYKASNILVKYEDDQIKSAIAIDYQPTHYGSPLNDLFYFIFGATDSQFRALHLNNIIQFYYKSLGEFLRHFLYDVEDVYPKEDFDADVKSHMMIGLLVAVNVLPYILVTEEQAPDLKNMNESAFVKAMRCPNNVFLDRYNEIVEDFIRWGYL